MSVSVKQFQTYNVHINENVKDINWRSHHALIVLHCSIHWALLMSPGIWKVIRLSGPRET